MIERNRPDYSLDNLQASLDERQIFASTEEPTETELIHIELTALIPALKRGEATTRNMSESGVDALLDRLLEIRVEEQFDAVFYPTDQGATE